MANPLSNFLMNIQKIMIGIILFLPLCALAEGPQTKIEVFVEQPLASPSIPNASISIFDLSQVDAVRATAPEFPADPDIAKGMAENWLNSADGKQFVSNLKLAYAGRVKMVTYGVLKLPAIVFDNGKYVIYGTTDVRQAVSDYDEYIRAHGTQTPTTGGKQNE